MHGPQAARTSALVLALLALAVVGGAAHAQSVAPSGSTSAVLEAAARVLADPNDAQGHAALARAYFQRGAVEDGGRCLRHARRAAELDPGLEAQLATFMCSTPPGRAEDVPAPTEEALNERLKATLPSAAPGQGASEDPEAVIHNAVAQRLARGRFRAPRGSYADNRTADAAMFGWGDESERAEWEARLAELGEASEGEQKLVRAFADATAPQMTKRSLDPKDDLSGQFVQGAEQVVVDGESIFKTKAEAMAAYLKGDTRTCVERVLSTLAGAETWLVQQAGAPAGASPPSPVALAALPGSTAPDDPFVLAPPMMHQIADKAIETLEALRNEKVPGAVAGGKVVELADVGNACSPLLLDLDGDGRPGVLDTLAADGIFAAEGAVRFDLDGDGWAERCEWLRPGRDALLFVDLDGDGLAGSGKELFGTAWSDRDGFARLARFDLDGDGWVAGAEATVLRLWRDDGDGRCEPDEVLTLQDAGVRGISCRPTGLEAAVRTVNGEGRCWDWWPDIRP